MSIQWYTINEIRYIFLRYAALSADRLVFCTTLCIRPSYVLESKVRPCIYAQSVHFLGRKLRSAPFIPSTVDVNKTDLDTGDVTRLNRTVQHFTPEQVATYEEIIAKANSGHTHLTMSKSYGVPLTHRDVASLDKDKCLYDSIVTAYCRSITKTAPWIEILDTQFYPTLMTGNINKYRYENVKRWTTPLSITERTHIGVPLHAKQHWTLLIIDLSEKTFVYYDPYGKFLPEDARISAVKRWFSDEVRNKYAEKQQKEIGAVIKWPVRGAPSYYPRQCDRSSCGLFILGVLECLASKAEPFFRELHLSPMRIHILLKLFGLTSPFSIDKCGVYV